MYIYSKLSGGITLTPTYRPPKSAKLKILRLFQASERRVFRYADLRAIFSSNREKWGLSSSLTIARFVGYLLDQTPLRRVELPLPYRHETLYIWGSVPIHTVALAVKPNAYLSHYTAMALHELTKQVPKSIYINVEQRPQFTDPSTLTQQSIDRAFKGSQRMTRNVAEFDGYRFVFVNGKHTGQLGVTSHNTSGETLRVTGLERTLVDIAVRPNYSGGVTEVAEAYRLALPHASVVQLADTFERMAYVYPYQQVLGYYLERAGASEVDLRPFLLKVSRFDFYLAYQMKSVDYNQRWKLFIPKGF